MAGDQDLAGQDQTGSDPTRMFLPWSEDGQAVAVPLPWHPDGVMAGLPAINAAAGQSTLGAVMTPAQMADVDWGDDAPNPQPSSDIPLTVSEGATWDKPVTSQAFGGQAKPAGTAPDPAGYARDGEMARQLQSDPYDPDGNTGNAGLAYTAGQMLQFHKGGTMDAQAHGGSQADGNYDFGVYNAAAGIPLPHTLDLANTYGKYFSKYPTDPNDPRYKAPDKNYPNIPAVNVQNITKGYNDYQSGKFGGTD